MNQIVEGICEKPQNAAIVWDPLDAIARIPIMKRIQEDVQTKFRHFNPNCIRGGQIEPCKAKTSE